MSDVKAAAATLSAFGDVAKVLDGLGDLDEAREKLEARVEELKADEARIRDGIAEMRNKATMDARQQINARAAADAELAQRKADADAYVKRQQRSGNDALIAARAEVAKIEAAAHTQAEAIVNGAKAEAAQHVDSVEARRRVIADLDAQVKALRATQAELSSKLKAAAT